MYYFKLQNYRFDFIIINNQHAISILYARTRSHNREISRMNVTKIA